MISEFALLARCFVPWFWFPLWSSSLVAWSSGRQCDLWSRRESLSKFRAGLLVSRMPFVLGGVSISVGGGGDMLMRRRVGIGNCVGEVCGLPIWSSGGSYESLVQQGVFVPSWGLEFTCLFFWLIWSVCSGWHGLHLFFRSLWPIFFLLTSMACTWAANTAWGACSVFETKSIGRFQRQVDLFPVLLTSFYISNPGRIWISKLERNRTRLMPFLAAGQPERKTIPEQRAGPLKSLPCSDGERPTPSTLFLNISLTFV